VRQDHEARAAPAAKTEDVAPSISSADVTWKERVEEKGKMAAVLTVEGGALDSHSAKGEFSNKGVVPANGNAQENGGESPGTGMQDPEPEPRSSAESSLDAAKAEVVSPARKPDEVVAADLAGVDLEFESAFVHKTLEGAGPETAEGGARTPDAQALSPESKPPASAPAPLEAEDEETSTEEDFHEPLPLPEDSPEAAGGAARQEAQDEPWNAFPEDDVPTGVEQAGAPPPPPPAPELEALDAPQQELRGSDAGCDDREGEALVRAMDVDELADVDDDVGDGTTHSRSSAGAGASRDAPPVEEQEEEVQEEGQREQQFMFVDFEKPAHMQKAEEEEEEEFHEAEAHDEHGDDRDSNPEAQQSQREREWEREQEQYSDEETVEAEQELEPEEASLPLEGGSNKSDGVAETAGTRQASSGSLVAKNSREPKKASGAWAAPSGSRKQDAKDKQPSAPAAPISSDDFIAQMIREQEMNEKKEARKAKKEAKAKVEKTTQRTASYARPWMTASVDKPLVASNGNKHDAASPAKQSPVPRLDLSRANLAQGSSRAHNPARKPAAPTKPLRETTMPISTKSTSPMVLRSSSPSLTPNRPGWAGSAKNVTRVHQPLTPDQMRVRKARERADMSAKPWRDPPPKRPDNAAVMKKVRTHDTNSPRRTGSPRRVASPAPSRSGSRAASPRLFGQRHHDTPPPRMPEGKEAERVHRAREAERRRKQEEVNLFKKKQEEEERRSSSAKRREEYVLASNKIVAHQSHQLARARTTSPRGGGRVHSSGREGEVPHRPSNLGAPSRRASMNSDDADHLDDLRSHSLQLTEREPPAFMGSADETVAQEAIPDPPKMEEVEELPPLNPFGSWGAKRTNFSFTSWLDSGMKTPPEPAPEQPQAPEPSVEAEPPLNAEWLSSGPGTASHEEEAEEEEEEAHKAASPSRWLVEPELEAVSSHEEAARSASNHTEPAPEPEHMFDRLPPHVSSNRMSLELEDLEDESDSVGQHTGVVRKSAESEGPEENEEDFFEDADEAEISDAGSIWGRPPVTGVSEHGSQSAAEDARARALALAEMTRSPLGGEEVVQLNSGLTDSEEEDGTVASRATPKTASPLCRLSGSGGSGVREQAHGAAAGIKFSIKPLEEAADIVSDQDHVPYLNWNTNTLYRDREDSHNPNSNRSTASEHQCNVQLQDHVGGATGAGEDAEVAFRTLKNPFFEQ